MSITEARLRALVQRAAASSEDLFRLLVEGLEWPVPGEMTLADVELNWDPAELHLDPAKVAKLQSIRQIPPLTASQDFGVFVLDFEGGRLPIGAIRRLVDRLVRRERARKGGGRHPIWALEDLLFFCFSTSGANSLHVVGFREHEGKRILRVLSWSEDTTAARMDLLMRRGIPDLRWADAGPAITVDLTGHGGFRGYREGIKSAAALSSRMAEVAQDVRDEVAALYEVETEGGPIRSLFAGVRDHLLGDLTPERFADVFAQTMVYGLLSARVAHPEQFSSDQPITALHFDNPFLDAIYARFRAQSDEVVDVDELGLRDLAEQLAASDIDELLADFGAKQRKDDPVVFFYEEFLAAYDPQQRKDLGAFYTPIPVVRFIVRAVDTILRRDFRLPLGVADGSTWGELVARETDISLPVSMDPDEPVIRMIDPGTGTGTFLVEWLRQAEMNFRRNNKDATADSWGVYLSQQMIPRMDALELSLASYAVAHLKLSLLMPTETRSALRLPIYLADTLAGPRPQVFDELADPVSAEGTKAEEVKFHRNHSVVIGNPPYDRDSSGSSGRRKGGMVRYDGDSPRPGLINDFLAPLSKDNRAKHGKQLYNDYAYFWRWALWKLDQGGPRPGIVSYITAASYLTGPGFGGMRERLRRDFDDIWLIDLGGEGRGTRKEENVFEGVLSPVVIALAVRRPEILAAARKTTPATVRYRRITGSRESKLDALEQLTLNNEEGWSLVDAAWQAAFIPNTQGDFGTWPSIPDLMPWSARGIQFSRTWPVAESQELASRRWKTLVSAPVESRPKLLKESGDTEFHREYRSFLTGRLSKPLKELRSDDKPDAISPVGYRSFDQQWCIADRRVIDRPRPPLWTASGPRQVYFTSVMEQTKSGPALVPHTAVPDLNATVGSNGGLVFPLSRDAFGKFPNLTVGLIDLVSAKHWRTVAAEEIVAYIYGLLGTGAYTAKYAKELASSTPRVPFTCNPGLFDDVVAFGRDLLWWGTFGERSQSRNGSSATLVGTAKNCKAKKAGGYPESFSYSVDAQTLTVGQETFSPVTPEVWNFEVSGLKVVHSWLSYRMQKRAGKKSSPLDDMRPEAWTFSPDLLELLHVVEHLEGASIEAAVLLEAVTQGPLMEADDFPLPSDSERTPAIPGAAFPVSGTTIMDHSGRPGTS